MPLCWFFMEFIEAPLFSKLIHGYLDDEEYSALQWSLALHPESGKVIPKSGGILKLRWPGKRKAENISTSTLCVLRKEIEL